MAFTSPPVPPPPPSVETPESPVPRVPLDWLLAPGRGWFRALRHAEFRLFWTGNLVSNVSSWMQNLAQGWLVLQLTGSPLWLGLVGFAQQVPALVFSLLGGVIADRASQRRLPVGALAEHWSTPTALGLSSGFALVLTAIIASAAPSVRHLK